MVLERCAPKLRIDDGPFRSLTASAVDSAQSKEFDEFLGIIGDRVKMAGWDKCCGGLDNKRKIAISRRLRLNPLAGDTTGKESVYAQIHGCEIMFHVSTLLPFYPDDEQQVERKRHLGNDVCMIIFQDPGAATFNPLIIKSQFNRADSLLHSSVFAALTFRR